jgi:hypothetical protein
MAGPFLSKLEREYYPNGRLSGKTIRDRRLVRSLAKKIAQAFAAGRRHA